MMMDIRPEEREYPHEQPVADNVLFHPARADSVLPVVDVLRTAYEKKLKRVVIIGLTDDNKDFVATSDPDIARNVYLCSRAEHILHCAVDVQLADENDEPPTGRTPNGDAA